MIWEKLRQFGIELSPFSPMRRDRFVKLKKKEQQKKARFESHD